jgi:hypothetical protein
MRTESCTHLSYALSLLSSLDREVWEKARRLKELALMKSQKLH